MDTALPAGETQDVFLVNQPAFTGTLQELLTALRNGRLPPSQLDLLSLVRDWLKHFERYSSTDLDIASEALPRVAQVLELKLRLLLPRQPRADEADELEEVTSAVELLVDMDNAVSYLRDRREDRRLLLRARVDVPAVPRARRPLSVPAGRLAELAGRLRSANYFEIARDGFGFREASRKFIDWVTGRSRFRFSELAEGHDWGQVTVLFAAMLELVRSGQVNVLQTEPFGEIMVSPNKSDAPPPAGDDASESVLP